MIAVQLENPFGADANDIDGRGMQMELNTHLMLLLSNFAQNVPKLTEEAIDLTSLEYGFSPQFREKSFSDAWRKVSNESDSLARRLRPPTTSKVFKGAQTVVDIGASMVQSVGMPSQPNLRTPAPPGAAVPPLSLGCREANVEEVTCVLVGQEENDARKNKARKKQGLHNDDVQGEQTLANGSESTHSRLARHNDLENVSNNSHGSSLTAADERPDMQVCDHCGHESVVQRLMTSPISSARREKLPLVV